MPLTAFQREVARILAAHRHPESHVAGGAVINRADSSYRYSEDLDIFHDAAASVAACAAEDAKSLVEAGCAVTWLLQQVGFCRAEVSRGQERVRLDWAYDSAFRFFPVQPDEDFGYCLHRADLAVNKVLAFAGRTEVRDFLDILYLDESYLSLGAMVWAACGKDAGYTPSLLLEQANRHSCFSASDLEHEALTGPVDLKELKRRWLASRERAERLLERLPEQDVGCLYVDSASRPVTLDPDTPEFPARRAHFGSVRGAWPVISAQ